MLKFKFEQCSNIEGLYRIEPGMASDERGYNLRTYNLREFKEAGLDMDFVDEMQSMSKRGVIRGLHFQKTYQQGKLVRVVSGEVFDVAVDIREESRTFGQWYGLVLSAEKKNMLYVPEGFAHGFLVLSEAAEFVYKLSDYYHPEDEGGLNWNDEALAIDWPIPSGVEVVTTEKDRSWPAFSEDVALKPKTISS